MIVERTPEGGSATPPPGGPTDGGVEAGGCQDASTDPQNCGVCGHVCGGENGCFHGLCGNVPIALRGSASAQHLCVLLANGTVWCWGENGSGQLGVGDQVNKSVATLIAKDRTGNAFDHVVDVTVGTNHTCALKDDKTLYCWGDNTYRQVLPSGAELFSRPESVNVRNAQLVRLGGDHTCVIDGNTGVQCWGKNGDGQLGHDVGSGNDEPCSVGPTASICRGTPTVVDNIANAKQLALGDRHTCAMTEVGSVTCWGANDYGQLASTNDAGFVTITVPLSSAIFGFYLSACALTGGGNLQCWGGNQSGELAVGHASNMELPGQWSLDGGFTQITGSLDSACSCTTAGDVFCAGFNGVGECGNGTTTGTTGSENLLPTPVLAPDGGAGLTNVVQLASAGHTNCALTRGGEIYCWGKGEGGQLGNGSTTDRQPLPVKVLGLPP